MTKKILSILIICIMMLSLCGCFGEKAPFSNFDGRFSPFFAIQPQDLSVADLVSETLLVTSGDDMGYVFDAASKGIGIANISSDVTGDGKTEFTVSLAPGKYFSDGEEITADDVIFSMYVYADRDYEGWSAFSDTDLVGLNAYRYGSAYTDDIEFTDEQYQAELESGDADDIIFEKIITPVLESEFLWIKRAYNDSGIAGTELEQYIKMYPEAKDLFAFLFSIDSEYDSTKVDDEAQVVEDIKKQYGADYKTLSTVMGVELTQSVNLCARDSLAKKLNDQMGGKEVDRIAGIEKVDEYTVKLTFNSGADENVINGLGIYVAPLHYYGDESLYDYDDAKFGFTKGDLSAVKEKNASPLGAGAYVMNSYKQGKGVSFSKNTKYFRQLENPSKVFFEETGITSSDKSHSYYVSADIVTYVEK